MNKWRSIITFLVDWTTSWIKTVEFSNKLIKWISIPRKDLKEALKRKELDNSWVYFLLWEDESWNDLAYIWQATVLKKRINDHNRDINKDFWNYAVIFTFKDWTLNESDINFLEKELIREAKKVWRYKIKNWNSWNNWLIQEYRIPDMLWFIEDLQILLSNLWFNVLKELINKKELNNNSNIFYFNWRWSDAKWLYTEEWFVILKWSKWPLEVQESVEKNKHYAYRNRPKLLLKGIIKNVENQIVFQKDYLFSSPSSAANLIWWWSYNGWITWKNDNWETLDEIIRKKVA